MGDFNYRIDSDNEEVRKLVELDDLDKLASYDQLCTEMKKGTVFHGLVEPQLTFLPTYKFDNGTNDYDTSYVYHKPNPHY